MNFIRKYRLLVSVVLGLLGQSLFAQASAAKYPDPPMVNKKTVFPIQLQEAEWKKKLTPEQFYILRKKAQSGHLPGYDHFYEKGTY